MNVLILGSTGFLGTYVTHMLLAAGHKVYCPVRSVTHAMQLFPKAVIFKEDFEQNFSIKQWKIHLQDIDVLMNCMGIFDGSRADMWHIHYTIPRVIYEAALATEVKKIIHVSALGIEQFTNEYAKSKYAIETYLKSSQLSHIILKPSFIYGRGAGGGIAWVTALASFPYFIPTPGKGCQSFQPIHVSDLATAITNLCDKPLPRSLILTAVSQDKILLKSMMELLRKWLGLKKASRLNIPISVIKCFAKVKDVFSRHPINLDAINMLEQGNTATIEDSLKFQEIIGFKPMNFRKGLSTFPSIKAERIYTRILFLKPLLRLSLAFMWLGSAFTSIFFYPKALSYQLLSKVGTPLLLKPFFLYGASSINALIGLGLLLNLKVKWNCLMQSVIILIYSSIISFKLTYLWWEPFGPVVKNIPILISIVILYTLDRE